MKKLLIGGLASALLWTGAFAEDFFNDKNEEYKDCFGIMAVKLELMAKKNGCLSAKTVVRDRFCKKVLGRHDYKNLQKIMLMPIFDGKSVIEAMNHNIHGDDCKPMELLED